MHSRNRKYLDMVVGMRNQALPKLKPVEKIEPTDKAFINKLTDRDLGELALEHRKRVLGRRLRRAARVMVVAAKLNATYKQQRHKQYIQNIRQTFVIARQNTLRISAVLVLVMFALVAVIEPLIHANNERLVSLSAESQKLVGESRDDAAQYLKFDSKNQSYVFEAPEQDKTDTYEHSGRNSDAYSVTLPKKAKEGVTLTDNKTKINVTLSPHFFTTDAKKTDKNNLVYQSGNRQMVYTLKYNGLKEDIIIPEYQSESLLFSFRLSLPSGVEARLDDDGNIGIYSSDPTLFGNISFGSDADREKVEKARQNGEKNNLVMSIPFPVVKDSKGQEYSDRSVFELGDRRVEKRSVPQTGPDELPDSLSTFNTYQLSVRAWNLKQLPYPISIDPTMQVTSSSDFNKLSTDGNTTIDTTNNLIKRGMVSGGTLNSWTTNATSIPKASYGAILNVYNGRVYYVDDSDTIQYAPINTDGSIGSFTSAGQVTPAFVSYGNATLSNGYFYVGNTSTPYYAKINQNGSLSSFTATSNFVNVRNNYTLEAINGYLYKSGGSIQTGCPLLCTNTYQADIEYAKINGDGTLSAWTSAGSNFTDGRGLHRTVSYNGYLYLLGGWDETNSFSNVQFAKIKADGSLNNWQTTSSITGGNRTASGIQIMNGYIYIVAGSDTNASSRYAPVYADGTIGTWVASTSITNGRGGVGSFVYNSRLYIAGGSANNGANLYADIQYTTPKPAGWTEPWTTTNSMTTARSYSASVAYNGYVYVVGGCTNQSGTSGSPEDCDAASTSVEYGTINSQTGAITWSGTTTALPLTGRWAHRVAAANGYMYVTAGCTTGLLGACTHTGDVLYAQISTTAGTLGSWTTRSNRITTNRKGHGFAVHNGYGYVVGGQIDNSSGVTTSTQYLQFNSDGTVPDTNWSNGTSINIAADFKTLLAHNNYLYYVHDNASPRYMDISSGAATGSWVENSENLDCFTRGGSVFINGYFYCYDGNGGTMNGEYAKANTNGSLTNIAALPAPGFTRDIDENMVTHNNFIYVLGSCNASTNTDCNGVTTAVNYTSLNNGGSGITSSWSTDNTGTLNTARNWHQQVAYNGYLYVVGGCTQVGGCTTTETLASVEYALINADGTLGSWTTASNSMGTKRREFGTAVYGGYIYAFGGIDSGHLSSVESAPLQANGDVGTWTSQGNMDIARAKTLTAQAGQYVYYLGSNGPTITSVAVSKLVAGGGLVSPGLSGCSGATWCNTTSVPEVSGSHSTAAVMNNRIYITGGEGNFNTYFSTVAADGSLSVWTKTSSPPFTSSGFTMAAHTGYVYRIGGGFTGNSTDRVVFAPVLSSGHLGAWQATANMPFILGYMGATMANGRVYVVGGNQNGTVHSDAQYASLRLIPRKAEFSKLYDFDSGVRPTKLITRGTKQTGSTTPITYTSSNNLSTTLDNSQSATDVGYNGANSHTINLGTNRTLSRYLLLRYTIDDSQSAVFPDSGNESTITDFDLYYTPNPGDRLRGGRSFNEGADRGLDAQPQ